MESSSDEKQKMRESEEPLLELDGSLKGGFRAIPFIIANEVFLAVATVGLLPNMILYLMGDYHLEMATGSNMTFFSTAANNFMPLIGAIIADSFLGRFRMIGFGSVVSLLLTSMIAQARPVPCNESNQNCSSATILQLFFLYTALGLISIGAGGIKSSSLPFGADQLKQRDDQENVGVIERYISWYLASWTFGSFISFSCIVFIQDKMGWKVGFGVSAVLMFISGLSFFLASPFYVKLKAKSNFFIELMQVIVASCRKRNIRLSPSTNYLYQHKEGSFLVLPSEKLRFMNTACIILDPQQELNPDGKPADPWSLCPVDHVENLKTLIKVIPLWASGMLVTVTMTQTSFTTVQVKSMNRKIGSSFEIPAGNFVMFAILCKALWVPLYDYIIQPIASRIIKRPVYFLIKQRMGLSIILSCLSMLLKAAIETTRRNIAISEGYLDDPKAIVNMSAMWVIPQLCLSGFADSIHTISLNEFFYLEFPGSMKSVASSLTGVGFSIANLLASFVMSAIDGLTKSGGNDSWVSSNINRGRYDYYFLVLACLSMANMIYFIICSRAYGPCKGEIREIVDKQEGLSG